MPRLQATQAAVVRDGRIAVGSVAGADLATLFQLLDRERVLKDR